jgi:hypothetical protein
MHTTTNTQPSLETLILRALRSPAVMKDGGREMPQVDWADLMDHVCTDGSLCDDQFLELMYAMSKQGVLVFNEDLGFVQLPAPTQDE